MGVSGLVVPVGVGGLAVPVGVGGLVVPVGVSGLVVPVGVSGFVVPVGVGGLAVPVCDLEEGGVIVDVSPSTKINKMQSTAFTLLALNVVLGSLLRECRNVDGHLRFALTCFVILTEYTKVKGFVCLRNTCQSRTISTLT